MKVAVICFIDEPGLHGRQEILWSGCLAGYLDNKGIDTDIFSSGLFMPELGHILQVLEKYDAVAMIGREFDGMIHMAAMLKKRAKQVITAAFGPYVSLCAHRLAESQAFDYVVSGEPEKVFYQLLHGHNTISSGIIQSDAPLDAAELPSMLYRAFPYTGLVSESAFGDGVFKTAEKAAVIYYERGCTGGCPFCQEPVLHGNNVRYRPVSDVIADIRRLLVVHGVNCFTFEDPWMTCSHRRVFDLCERISREFPGKIRWRCHSRVGTVNRELLLAMKKAGCIRVDYGVETSEPEAILGQGKGFDMEECRATFKLHEEIGLPAFALMMAGFPGDTRESLLKSAEFARSLNPAGGIGFSPFRPLPGTPGWDVALENGRILTDNFKYHSSLYIVYEPHSMPAVGLRSVLRDISGRDFRIAPGPEDSEAQRNYFSFSANSDDIEASSGTFIEVEGRMFIIDPLDWYRDEWDETRANIWKPEITGPDSVQQGISHIVCRMTGCIEYCFYSSRIISGYPVIRFRGSSQDHENASEIQVFFDEYPVGTFVLPPKTADGSDAELAGQEIITLQPGRHLLKISVPSGSRANGLSIFTSTLAGAAPEKPVISMKASIVVEFF